MRSSAITAAAPASCAISACSPLITSMITPPFSISANPTLRRNCSCWFMAAPWDGRALGAALPRRDIERAQPLENAGDVIEDGGDVVRVVALAERETHAGVRLLRVEAEGEQHVRRSGARRAARGAGRDRDAGGVQLVQHGLAVDAREAHVDEARRAARAIAVEARARR